MLEIDESAWRPRLQRLAGQLANEGAIRTPPWRKAVEAIPRHVFVPHFYDDEGEDSRLLIEGEDPAQQRSWLEAVYSDATLVTQLRSAPVPAEYGGGSHTRSTSSSTKPSAMLAMLEDLDIRDGHRVLEIGTGTGYTAALLCARLGDTNVASIDIDPTVVEAACERLARLGFEPVLSSGDGADGLPAVGPYDRVIATCAVSAIPAAWLEQLRPGGIILADLRGDVSGGLLKLQRAEDGTGEGRFLSYPAPFMWLREHAEDPLRARELPYLVRDSQETHESSTRTDPALLQDRHFSFLAQLHLPGVRRFPPSDGAILLYQDECTWAEASQTPDGHGAYRVTHSGEYNLWDRVETAHQLWEHAGQPGWDRFGVTVTTDRQWAWLDTPDGPRAWPLPL